MNLLQHLCWLRLIIWWDDVVVQDHRSLVDTNDLDGGSMNAQRACNSVNKLGGATVVEELIHGPLHSDHGLDGISWCNLEGTSSCEVELKDILDTDVPVLSTTFVAKDWSIRSLLVVPVVHVHSLSILENLS